MNPEINAKAEAWLSPTFDETTQKEVKKLIEQDSEELTESFYKNLEFGTGGMRGIMGVGTNRINKYTLGKNTQGLSNYLKEAFLGKLLKVAIAYDCRNNSKELAQVVADVFSANDIQVYLFSDLRATPELSFAVKHLDCHCGIVLTASHNPPEYNGYKVYWQDGGQLVPPQDSEIVAEIERLDYSAVNFDAKKKHITYIDKDVDKAFIKASLENGSFSELDKHRDDVTIVFTPLHGTSITIIPDVLEGAGYKNVHIVEEQRKPDGNFPTVKSPNPEEPEALKMAMDLAEEKNADIVIGTDPDCDRLGIAVRDNSGKLVLLNGNQTMVVMTDFLLENYFANNTAKGNEFVGSTIVSTPMMETLAKSYDIECKLGLTGFKWIAKMIVDYPNQKFIGGGEESFGFMVGDFVRDKDAVTATLLACEIVTKAKKEGSSFFKKLQDLYVKHGFFKEDLTSLVKKGISGAEEIKQTMIDLRENPLTTINGEKIVKIDDYASSKSLKVSTGESTDIDIPKANVLIYHTDQGSRIAARPSGTEPKIKFYISVNDNAESLEDLKKVEEKLDAKIAGILKELGI
ncbi:phospho-sugar mutase [Leeuwenhoekiella marinoflava]|uniref:Phosphomannomutase n=2 Tax=Leeuwenhoekiella marinoflava TaxID=988 RepID=A0A4Q0PIX3_9FLAO|nr:phospho-sugar mutase [Leeuwenhoekiella marinoflava]RXG27207.1 phosphomannomutase [Leeuwenhoekiella marinoflava]SHF78690.1 Phosphomannomutase [Leeuwenhoekiella marinoflava DSM 3653]